MFKVARLCVWILMILALAHGVDAQIAARDLDSAVRLEKQGENMRAADAYLRVLRLEPGNQKAKSGLTRVAGRAIGLRVAAAIELEQSSRFADAHAELLKAVDIRDRSLAAGIKTVGEVDLTGAFDSLVDRWIEALYLEAAQSYDQELWSAALADLQQIEALRPGHADVRNRMVDAWTEWGRMDLGQNRYRTAAERFREASLVPGAGQDASSRRAAAPLTSLGSSALDNDACRSALKDLEGAERLVPGIVDPEVMTRARTCALTCIELVIVSDLKDGMDAPQPELIESKIRSEVRSRSTEFLRLIDGPKASDGLCSLSAKNTSAQMATLVRPSRYRSVVEISEYGVLRLPATSRNREHRTHHSSGAETLVVAREYVEQMTGNLSGSVTFANQRNGRESPEFPVRIASETMVTWIKGPLSAVTTQTRSSGSDQTGALIDPRLPNLTRVDDRRREARLGLRITLTDQFADKVARLIVELLDSEPAVADPIEIDLPADLFPW